MEELKFNTKYIGRLKEGEMRIAGITLLTGDVDLPGIISDIIMSPRSCTVQGDSSLADRPGPDLLSLGVIYGDVHMDDHGNPQIESLDSLYGRRTYVLRQPEVAQSYLLDRNYRNYVYPPKQLKIVEELVSLFKSGVRVIVLSNSDYILFGLRIALKQGLITPSDLSIVYLQDDGGVIDYVGIRSFPNGELEDWPTGFFDTFDKCLMELV